MKHSKIAARIFEEANDALEFDIKSLILNGNLEELTLSENAQPAVVTASYALFRDFEAQTGIQPYCALGHSLGEISAIIAAGGLSFTDGIRYVRKRGKLMHQAMQENKGRAGIVVDMHASALTSIVESINKEEYLSISGYNSPNQFIVAGNANALLKVDAEVHKNGGEFIPFRMMPMKADAPYHTSLMSFLESEVKEIVHHLKLNHLHFSIYSTVTGQKIETKERIPDILTNQLVQPVLWNQAITEIAHSGADLFIDIGPQQIVKNFINENKKAANCLAYDNDANKEEIMKYAIQQA